jgi:hypothetical protein
MAFPVFFGMMLIAALLDAYACWMRWGAPLRC